MLSQARVEYELKATLSHAKAKEALQELLQLIEDAMLEMVEELAKILALISISGAAVRSVSDLGHQQVSAEKVNRINQLLGQRLLNVLQDGLHMPADDIVNMVDNATPKAKSELFDLLSN